MDIKPEDYNYTCFIVGGGSSLNGFDWSLLDGKFVIAINNAYMKLPDAQILYCTDPPWIQDHMEGLKKFKGLKWQGVLKLNQPAKLPVIDKQWHLTGPTGLETKPNSMRHGSNSTYAAINMAAVHLGFKTIYLLGIDMKWGSKRKKETSHWHATTRPHRRIDGEAVYKKLIDNYETIKKPLLEMGVTVINLNTPEKTDLKSFPIRSIESVLTKG